MSEYEHKKIVAYPITDEVLEKLGEEDIWDLEYNSKYKDKFCSSFDYEKYPDKLSIEGMYNNEKKKTIHLIIKVLEDCYGSGEYGRSRYLTKTEQEKYSKYFNWIPDFSSDKLKYVDYCYYNGCDCPDFYSGEADDFNKEI